MRMTQDIDRLVEDFRTSIRSHSEPRPVIHKAFGARPLGAILTPPVNERPMQPEDLPSAVRERIPNILLAAARTAFSQLRLRRTRSMLETFEQAVLKHALLIIQAAKIDRERQKQRQHKRYIETRRTLATELKGARQRLIQLQRNIKSAELGELSAAGYAAKAMAMACAPLSDRSPVPPPMLPPHADGLGLPAESGIYFLWRDEVVDYVGRSINLGLRLRLGSHHVLSAQHRISYLLLPRHDLTWAECYYIGIMRPKQNFGRSATHYRAED